jgi:hypothetical protein
MDAKFIRRYATLSLVMSIRGMKPTATFTASLCEGKSRQLEESEMRPDLRARASDKVVAQICDLPYRRFAIDGASESSSAPLVVNALAESNSAIRQITNLRYGLAARGHSGG